MRRVLGITLILAACGTLAVFASGSGDGATRKYKIELQSAFGLIEGADLKIAGVRAGKIKKMDIDRKTLHAFVTVTVPDTDARPLLTDASCESRPQSLIGEYFIDCQPGKHGKEIPDGGTVPISRTFSTIGPDVINNILRLPERERLTIILNELGAGVAARGDDLNVALRRAVPALRETDDLLAKLARENQVLGDLTKNSDAVITALAKNRHDVGQFVTEAKDTAEISASRRQALQQTFHKLPDFLAQLGPAMKELGRVAGNQAPALRDLDASASQLTDFFDQLAPFSRASQASFESLGSAAKIGHQALSVARPAVQELGKFAKLTPEVGKNLRIILEDLNSRDRAIEKDGRSPGGQGYTGLEALLQYVFWQSLAVNIYDKNGYLLKVSLRADECAPFRDASVKKEPDIVKECSSGLGPNQPGLTTPDPTATAQAKAQLATQAREAQVDSLAQDAADAATSTAGAAPAAGTRGPAIDLGKTLGDLLGGTTGALNSGGQALGNGIAGALSGVSGALTGRRAVRGLSDSATIGLLDYLLAP
jgi:ABC-type transporter Mla subunit MlaD